jgi:hypothetical protein
MARVMTHLSVDRVRNRDARRCQMRAITAPADGRCQGEHAPIPSARNQSILGAMRTHGFAGS